MAIVVSHYPNSDLSLVGHHYSIPTHTTACFKVVAVMTAWVISGGKCRMSLIVTWCALSPLIHNCEAGLRFMKLDYFYCHVNIPPAISTALCILFVYIVGLPW